MHLTVSLLQKRSHCWGQQYTLGVRDEERRSCVGRSLPSQLAGLLKWRTLPYLAQTCFLQYGRRPEEYLYNSSLKPLSNYIFKTVILHCAAASFLSAWLWLRTVQSLNSYFSRLQSKSGNQSHVCVQPLLSLMRTVRLQQMEPNLSSPNRPLNPPLLK